MVFILFSRDQYALHKAFALQKYTFQVHYNALSVVGNSSSIHFHSTMSVFYYSFH